MLSISSYKEEVRLKHLMEMISWSFEKEKVGWKSCPYKSTPCMIKGTEVNGQQRDDVVSWLLKLNDRLNFLPETIFTAVAVMDRFLHTVKAHPRYLQCIAITCFYVAIKITEEYEVIPSISQLLDVSGCSCSVSELLRMERIILKKLNWNLKHVTAFDFLHMFHKLMAANCSGLLEISYMPSGNFSSCLGMKLKSVLPYHRLAAFPPSTVALSLISLELELRCKKLLPLIIHVQNFVQNNSTDLMICQNEMSRIMSRVTEPLNISWSAPMIIIPSTKFKTEEKSDVERNVQ